MSDNVTGDPLAEPVLRVDTQEELVYLLKTASRRQRQHTVRTGASLDGEGETSP
jgi:hypothetical protein